MDNAQYTTSGQLAELVDKKVLIVLRDNRKLIGVLRSYDQYGTSPALLLSGLRLNSAVGVQPILYCRML